ncbi:hypothetical protein GF336_07720 [Candidatus Woesearchaeota archaeon]|nr:hypothetical protein [Candidatus Woesearchaeota archaeon]
MKIKMEKFKQIIKKYNLEDKAEEIAEYVTSKEKEHFSLKEFAEKFNLEEKDAKHLLETIYKAVEAREKYLKEVK